MSRLWLQHGCEDSDRGCLSGAVGTEKSEDAAGSQCECESLQRAPGPVRFPQILCHQQVGLGIGGWLIVAVHHVMNSSLQEVEIRKLSAQSAEAGTSSAVGGRISRSRSR